MYLSMLSSILPALKFLVLLFIGNIQFSRHTFFYMHMAAENVSAAPGIPSTSLPSN